MRVRRVSSHVALDAALDALRGVELPQACLQRARDEATWHDHGTYRRTPLLALLRHFSRKWKAVLDRDGSLREALCDVLDRVARQMEIAETRHLVRTADLACRAARRYLLLLARYPDLGGMEACAEWVEEHLLLPSLSAAPGSPCGPLSQPCIDAFLRALRCFRSGAPLVGAHQLSREREDETFETFEDKAWLRGRFAPLGTTRWSCLDPLRPVATGILRDSAARLAAGGEARPVDACYLLGLVCLCYGFDHLDALVLTVGRPASPMPGPGWIDLEGGRLVRRIGTGFHSGDGAFERSDLSLPLVPEIAGLARRLGLQPDGRCLHEHEEMAAHAAYRSWVRRRRRACLPTMARLHSVSLHLVFDYAALFEARLQACELSLLRAAPRYGAATECSYTSMTEGELLAGWNATVAVLRGRAGLAPFAGVAEVPERSHGTVGLPFSECVARVAEQARAATCRNEALAAMEGGRRCLGGRNTLRHESVAACVRGCPEPTLLFVDKWRGGRALGARYLPLCGPVEEFAALCAEHCGAGPLLYEEGGARVMSDVVADRDLFRWLNHGSCRQVARTALFNELRRRRVPAHVRAAIMGHGSELTWESVLLPVPNAELLGAIRAALLPLLRDCGFHEALAALRDALERFPDEGGEPCASRAEERHVPWGEGAFAPLSDTEDFLACAMLANLPLVRLPANGAASLVLTAVELGAPSHGLLAMLRQATFRCLVDDEESGRTFFGMPVEGTDVGHLDHFPLEFPPGSAALRHLRGRWKALCRSRSPRQIERTLDEPLFGETHGLEKRLGLYVSRLAGDEGHGVRLAEHDALRLLDRVSASVCRHRQCGSVAAALAREIPAGINQIEMGAVFARVLGRRGRLRHWHGKEFCGELYRTRSAADACEERRDRYNHLLKAIDYEQWPQELVGEGQRAQWLYERFLRGAAAPGRARYRDVALLLGSPAVQAARIAGKALRLARRHGALVSSRAEAVPTREEVRAGWERIAAGRLDVRGRGIAAGERARADVVRSLELLVLGGCRLSESARAVAREAVREPEFRAHYIPLSKTEAGRRMVLPAELSREPLPPPAGPEEWNRRKLDLRKKQDRRKHAARVRRLDRQMKGVFGRRYRLHSLRHYRADEGLAAARERHAGNFALMLATMARMFGHASMLTFLNTYVGTLLAGYAARPVAWPGLAGLFLRGKAARLRGALRSETQLRDEYSGLAFARAELLREQRRWAAGSAAVVTGSVVFADLRSEAGAARLQAVMASASTRVADLPPAPELPLYWQTIEFVMRRARWMGVQLVIHLPETVQYRHSEKLTRLARSAGLEIGQK
jgi:hypothetical protein